jgi:hypothetical protein
LKKIALADPAIAFSISGLFDLGRGVTGSLRRPAGSDEGP